MIDFLRDRDFMESNKDMLCIHMYVFIHVVDLPGFTE